MPSPASASGIAPRNPIDAFLQAALVKRGLAPTPEAPKEVLLRRVFLDLAGLPPTRQELRDFLEDASPGAYERVVDRLLDSPRHGERWARHWMDIWRYADWYGRRHVPDVWNSAPQIWRWRDWIVQSLNQDKGYDRMLAEMLAADEIAPGDDETRVATGYLARNWYALNPNQWMRDVVEHTGKAFLGLTFNCAHCHDHKYDPITQRDYFQFRAFFEPLGLRQDRSPGQPDPGLFQKYEYSTLRKVATNGMVSVFDEHLEAETHVYLMGDERNLPEGKPVVAPAMPAFLGGDRLEVRALDLPAVASYPGLKPFIQQAETEKRRLARDAALAALETAGAAAAKARAEFDAAEGAKELAPRASALASLLAAESGWRQRSNDAAVAQAELGAIEARIRADNARYSAAGPGQGTATGAEGQAAADLGVGAPSAASAAFRAERLVALRQAESGWAAQESALALLLAEQAAAAARRAAKGASPTKEESDQAAAALKQARDKVEAARKSMEAAQAALNTNSGAYTPLTPAYPARSTGRRRALAAWLGSPENPLTARVAVNHMWARHFHAPLVATVYDFGRNGAAPTHPELLDWLAVELMEHGWSMKHLHRLIVTSRAYRQLSAAPREGPGAARPASESADPQNRYLWRMNPGQMEAEVVRDSVLHLAGHLDLAAGGYPLPNKASEDLRRRSLWFECFPEPGGQSDFGALFDPPGMAECYRRTETIVPQQALALSNSKLCAEQSRNLAGALDAAFPWKSGADQSPFIAAAFEQVLARPPMPPELELCRDYLNQRMEPGGAACSPAASNATPPAASEPERAAQARASLVHALFNHNDFVSIR